MGGRPRASVSAGVLVGVAAGWRSGGGFVLEVLCLIWKTCSGDGGKSGVVALMCIN